MTVLAMMENETMQTSNELSAIGATIDEFFTGMHTGDVDRLRHAFHPDAYLFGYYKGCFSRLSLDDWMEEVRSEPKPSESNEPFDMRIVATDVTGKVATVKTATLYLGLRFTDYLTLAQFDDGWKIINKAYHHD